MHAKVHAQYDDTPLSDAQWAGLARLGDLGDRLGPLLDGPLAGPAGAKLERLGEFDAEHDLTELAAAFIQAVSALNQAGLLRLIRDNAQFIADSLEVIAPLAAQWMEQLSRLPADEIKTDAAFALQLLRKTRLLGEFAQQHLAGELTGHMNEATEFIQRNQTDKALAELLVQLGRLHRNGMLTRLGDLAEYLSGLEEGSDFRKLAGSMVDAAPEGSLGQLPQLLHGLDQVVRDTREDENRLGGYSGLIHLLRDPQVQKGLRMLAQLTAHLEQQPKENASG
ncbi:MAG: DUF1641 domain-containing protein [Acidihalobacter sp.]